MSEATVESTATNKAEDVKPEAATNNTAAPKPSPAQDLRDIQALVVNGIYPGNMAPAIVKAYQLLDQMALVIEREASKNNVQETK